MDFEKLAAERYSERFFDSRPVEQEKIDKILAVGRLAPTACNYQPQRIYVMQSEEALKKVRNIRVSHFNAPLMMLICYDAAAAWRNPRDEMYDSYCSGEQDATIVAATMMYEAQELGVHTVWLRGFNSSEVKKAFSLPENIIPVMMFAMGYPANNSAPNPWHFMRKSLDETVTVL
ncbi:MAG: nitroreductase family protein [Clostridia bacterium]|nr:nitroreductase family protein [Clostridia bacterium]